MHYDTRYCTYCFYVNLLDDCKLQACWSGVKYDGTSMMGAWCDISFSMLLLSSYATINCIILSYGFCWRYVGNALKLLLFVRSIRRY